MSLSIASSESPPAPDLPGHSLLQLDLVRVALTDPAVRWCARQVDANWQYAGILPQSMSGFNPVSGAVYHGVSSATASWLTKPEDNARLFNEKDRLMREVLFGVHDYLHSFAYRAIQQRRPELGFGVGPITRENFETHVFLHLLTEAVATVGLDYWFLCTFDLNRKLEIGTAMRSLTVSYRLDDEAEYGLFAPGFTAQTPSFLSELCTFYCTGDFIGFGLDDVRRSPRLMNWLSHEIAYGATQRTYTRQWFEYLSCDELRLSEAALAEPVACDAPWQTALMTEIGDDLWALVKDGQRPHHGVRCDERRWTSSIARSPDFRFVNIAAVDLDEIATEIAAGRHTARNASFAFDQFISTLDFHSVAPEHRSLVSELRRRADLGLAMKLFRGARRVPSPGGEPRDIFLLT